jgi:hypothetical protein
MVISHMISVAVMSCNRPYQTVSNRIPKETLRYCRKRFDTVCTKYHEKVLYFNSNAFRLKTLYDLGDNIKFSISINLVSKVFH